LCNSNVTHSLASSEYNVRRQECEEGVSVLNKHFPEIKALRDATIAQLDEVKEELTITVAKRCRYVIEENERVGRLTAALSESRFERVGEILKEAQKAMRYAYEITCPEIDLMADYANDHANVLGARMMGGGFGGCILVLLEKVAEESFTVALNEAYQREFGKEITPIKVKIADGVRRVMK
jgi:galactokinase